MVSIGISRGRRALTWLTIFALLFATSCGGQPPVGKPPSPDASLFVSDPVTVTSDGSGEVAIASTTLSVEYRLDLKDEDGNPVSGIRVDYGENSAGTSFFTITDPEERYQPVVIVGAPYDIAGLPFATQQGVATYDPSGSGGAERQEIILAFIGISLVLATITAAQVTFIFAAFENKVYLNTELMEINDDYLQWCWTADMIAGYYKNQAQMVFSTIEVAKAMLMVGKLGMKGKLSEIPSAYFNVSDLVTVDPFEFAKDILDLVAHVFVTVVGPDTRMPVRMYNWTSKTSTTVLFEPLHIIGTSCDPNSENFSALGTLELEHDPPFPAAGQSVNVIASIEPKSAGLEVLFEAKGTDGYYKRETKISDADGRAVFFVPGGAAGVKDDYYVIVAELGLAERSTLTFGGMSSLGGDTAAVLPRAPSSTR